MSKRKQLSRKIALAPQLRLVQAKSVRLADGAAPAIDPAQPAFVPTVWVEVTEAGDYRGYPGGRFVFDKSTFQTIVTNFRKHPSFVAGADGVGTADVVPWDFNHASEYAASDGSIPAAGTPAQGWIQDLEVRLGIDGKAQLWAKTRWLEPARTYVLNGQYKWASVVVDFAARDPETNVALGPMLVSVALTNNPFVEGMVPLVAASKHGRGAQRIAADMNYYGGAACSADDALDKLKQVLGLPAISSVGDVLAQLSRMQEWVVNGGAPLGVELDELLGSIRTILNMPALSSTDEVFAETQKLLQRLLEDAALDTQTSTAAPGALPPDQAQPAAPAAMSRNAHMNLIKILASKLGCQETDAAITAALDQLIEVRALLAKLSGVETTASDKKLLEAGAGVADARGKLKSILDALGVPDSDQAINKIASVMEQAAKLKEVMPELEGLKAEAAKTEEATAEADVDQALASKGLSKDDDLRFALVALRKSNKEEFAKRYPKKAPEASAGAGTADLTRSVATSKAGGEKRIEIVDGQVRVIKPVLGKQPVEGRISLAKYAGRNIHEKALAFVRAQAGGDKLTYDQAFEQAAALVRAGKVTDEEDVA
jgi:hypothetical protein